MFALDGTVILSATDLTVALTCEYALLRRLDEVLERAPRLEVVDLVRERAAALGDAHELRVLEGYRERFGDAVVEIEPVTDWTREELVAAHERTVAALAAGAPVVAQASFFDGRLHGRADFLVREGEVDGVPRYAVVDAKLARRARATAILQLAVYADQVERAGIAVAPTTHLHLGNDVVTRHDTADSLVVTRGIRAHVQRLVDRHVDEPPVAWGDERITACGWCEHCRAAIEPARDLRLVWGLRDRHRETLRDAGITTIDALAASDGEIRGMNPHALERLRTQARLQLRQERAAEAGQTPSVFAQVHTLDALDELPPPDPGDVFFDFEGDPMWVDDDRSTWGLEYLFGLLEAPTPEHPEGRYVTFWAHDRAQERQAFLDFLDYLRRRRAEHPGMHVYHSAFYEPAALRQLAARHGVGREEVEELLGAGVFVDLYETVKRGVHVSQRSYSIKKLEPLYMGDRLRDADGVTDGGASVVAYAEAAAMRAAGDEAGWAERMAALADYNRYDCESTWRLRDWLLALRADAHRERLDEVVAHAAAALGAEPVAELQPELVTGLEEVRRSGTRVREHELLVRRLLARDDPDPAVPLVAAALGYHDAEDEAFWSSHRARLQAAAPDWADEKDVLDVHHAEAEPWGEPTARGRMRRHLVVEGRLGPGSTIEPGADVFCVYRPPLPIGMQPRAGQVRGTSRATVLARTTTADGLDRLELRERLDEGVQPHSETPMLVAPGPPPRSRTLVSAIGEVARGLLGDTAPVAGAALDVLRRTPPRQRSGALPAAAEGASDALATTVTAALLDSDDSYLAVQGPPGTGKTWLSAAVVARLVRDHGWRVGVVAQSHAVVEHLLDGVVAAGVPVDAVAKRGGDGGWRRLGGAGHHRFLDRADGGCVLGGTSWDFANRNRVAAGSLDLLVVEEAGQLSLANLLATATAARRLLLVGDPQQLPQVSQARHDAPVDTSALGWLMRGHDVLPDELGYFLDRTWRMHPSLCQAVSQLAYDDRLGSAPPAAARHLEGVEPGVHEVLVEHRRNVARSPEEAAEVVAQVERLLGRTWSDEHGTRPLTEADVVVVAPYNAQVQAIDEALAGAGLGGVRVGTVDRFQGQEAVVAVLSLAASTARDAARGLGFLLDRHRINVALSRARWAAIVVRSPALTRTMPTRADELADLAAFLRVSGRAHEHRPRARRPVAAAAAG